MAMAVAVVIAVAVAVAAAFAAAVVDTIVVAAAVTDWCQDGEVVVRVEVGRQQRWRRNMAASRVGVVLESGDATSLAALGCFSLCA